MPASSVSSTPPSGKYRTAAHYLDNMSEREASQEVSRTESHLVNHDSCPDCGQPLDRIGACEICRECGFSPCG